MTNWNLVGRITKQFFCNRYYISGACVGAGLGFLPVETWVMMIIIIAILTGIGLLLKSYDITIVSHAKLLSFGGALGGLTTIVSTVNDGNTVGIISWLWVILIIYSALIFTGYSRARNNQIIPLFPRPITGQYISIAPQNGEMCSICLDLLTENVIQMIVCSHCFHKGCINNWLIRKQNCPNCRSNTTSPV
uniref:RING-type domain-containing protein n=1 Tax=viral metagenome TaxID=1070528 RepID=A0A6C0EPM0_9ZZZZ